ncbi:MAG: ABC transporter permease, partial [Nitrospinae bacterium]|nr:ABC transporter permease [Nitrospinota bacterium]
AQGANAEESAADGVSISAVTGGGAVYFILLLFGLYLAYPGHTAHLWTSVGGAAVFVYLYQRFEVTELLQRFRLPKVDIIYTTIVDVQLSFPSFFVLLTILALVTPNIWIIMVVIGVLGWVGPARFVRAEILSLREQPFVESARSSGGSDRLIIFRYLIPNSLAPVLVSATIGIAGAILTEASLSFLGFGVPPPQASWGNIFSDGKKYIFDAPWLTFIPGFAILVVMLAFNLFGEGLRDAMNPRANSK